MPGFSENQRSTEDMQNKQKQNYLVGTGSFADQKQQKLFENNEVNFKKRRKRKRRKKININYDNIEGIQNLCESSRVNLKKHINSKKELHTFFGNLKYYKEPIKTSPLTPVPSPVIYPVTNRSCKISNNFNEKLSNNYNVDSIQRKNGDKLNSNNKFRSNNDTNRPNYSRQSVLNSSDTNVNMKEDTDLFYFDICGNKIKESISLQQRKHIKNRLNFFMEINNCNKNFNNRNENMKFGVTKRQPNLNNKFFFNEKNSLDISETTVSIEQNSLDKSVIDSKDNYLQINGPTWFKKIEHKNREIDEQKINKNVEQNCFHKNIFNCDTSNNCKDKKLTLGHSKKKRKKNGIGLVSNDSFFLCGNVKTNQICDKNDVPTETDSQYLTSKEVGVICTEDKNEPYMCYKKGKNRKKNKRGVIEMSDYNCEVSPRQTKNELYTDYLKHNNDLNVLLEYNISEDTENDKNNFQIPPKVKKKKSERKSLGLIVVSDNECEIVDFVACSGKKKDKHITYTVEEDCNNAPKKKSKRKTKIGNNIQENTLACNSNKTKNLLPNLPKMLRNGSRESNELNAINEPIFFKSKKKKHKSCQVDDNGIDYIENKNMFKKSIEDEALTADSSRLDGFENNSNRNMLNLHYVDSQKNKSILLTVSPETKDCGTLKCEHLKANNMNGKNCHECDFISSKKIKKKQKFIDGELDINDIPKRKRKLEAKENDIENKLHEIFYNNTEKGSHLSKNTSKNDSNEYNSIDDYVKPKRKKPNVCSKNNVLNYLKKEVVAEEYDIYRETFKELNNFHSVEENQYSNQISDYSKIYGPTSRKPIESENKLLSRNQSYKISSNLQAKTNKKSKKSKVKDVNTPILVSEDECEIIEYVSSSSKKKRKHITSTESDISSTSKKENKTTSIKFNDNKIENILNNSAPRKKYCDESEFDALSQTGDITINYTEKLEKLKEEVNIEQQKNYNKLDTIKSVKKKHCQDCDDFKNHNSISQENKLNNNKITCKTKNNMHRDCKVFDDDQSSDSSEIIISEWKSIKSTNSNAAIHKNNASNLSNNAKGSKYSIDKSTSGAISKETNLNSTTEMTRISVKVEIKDNNEEEPSNSENKSMILEEKTKNIKNLDTSVNIPEKECEIINCVSLSKKKEMKHAVKLDTHIGNTLKKIPIIAKLNTDEKAHNGHFFKEFNLVQANKKNHKHPQIRENSLYYTEDEEMLMEEVNSEQQKNYNELDTVKSLKDEHCHDELEKGNNIRTNHERICETYNSTHGSPRTFADDQSSGRSEIIGAKQKHVQHNTEIYEESTGNSTNDALTSSKYHSSDTSIETTTNKTNLKSTARTRRKSGHIKNKENDDKNRNSPCKIRRTSVFAEYMQNKENNVTSEKKLTIPEISPDPEEVEDDIEKLRNLKVLFPFTIPPLHALTTRTTRPTKEQLEKIEQMKLPITRGPFSKEEDEKIIENWKRFCKEHNLTTNPILFIKFPKKMEMETKINILRYIAHGMDNRLLHRIYIRFRHLLQKDHLKTGRFTPEEDKILLEFLANTKSMYPFKDLSELLRRTRTSVERRYVTLTSNNKVTHWTLEMVDRFVRALLKITKCEKIKKLKRREFTSKEWKKLSKKLDNISVKKLQRAWKVTIYPRLFSKEVDMREMKEDIIHILCDRNETDWRKVDWKEIAKYFRGFTAEKIYMMFKHLSNFHVPKEKHSDLKECLDFLKNKVLKYDRIASTHKFKKFIVKNGHLTYNIEDFD